MSPPASPGQDDDAARVRELLRVYAYDPNIPLLGEIEAVASGVSAEVFLKRYDHPFLLLLSSLDADPRSNAFQTQATDATSIKRIFNNPVFFVRKRGTQNPFGDMITVGRSENNDIALRWPKLSKFHAFFSVQDGRWRITDSDSSNGTYIERERLTPRTPITLGDEGVDIAFSKSLAFYFLSPAGMLRYLETMGRFRR